MSKFIKLLMVIAFLLPGGAFAQCTCYAGLKNGTQGYFKTLWKKDFTASLDILFQHDYTFWDNYAYYKKKNTDLDAASWIFSGSFSDNITKDEKKALFKNMYQHYKEDSTLSVEDYKMIAQTKAFDVVYRAWVDCQKACTDTTLDIMLISYDRSDSTFLVTLYWKNPTDSLRTSINTILSLNSEMTDDSNNTLIKGNQIKPQSPFSSRFRILNIFKDATISIDVKGYGVAKVVIPAEQKELPDCKYLIDTAGVGIYPGFTLLGAVYNNMPYVKDDNPPGFTQTYLRLSFLRNCKKEYNPCKKGVMTPHLFRNFFGQVLYSANAPDVKPYYGYRYNDSSKLIGFVNRLDLYQYANLHLTLLQNVLTLKSNDRNYWETTIYVDALAELLRTAIADTMSDENKAVNSWLLGVSVKGRFKGLRENQLFRKVAIEPYAQVFWVNPMTNSFNYELNIQNANTADMLRPENAGKQLAVPQQAYSKVGLIFMYSLRETKPVDKSTDDHSVFIHLAYTSNFYSSANYYFNSYFQAQLGLRLNISSLIGHLTDGNANSNAGHNTNGNAGGNTNSDTAGNTNQ